MVFNEILRELIAERDLTQKQVANDLHISVSTLGGYVQGTSEPDFEMLKTLARYFNTTPDFLLDFKSDNTESSLEKNLIRIFRSLSEEEQEIYLEQGKAFLKSNNSQK